MGEKFRWAYVGSGSIARQTAHQIVKGNHIISSVFSRNIEKAKDFAGSYNAKAYDNFDAMLQAGGFDAVYIGTPHTSHVNYAIRSMNAGYPVLCEKPAGVSLKEVNALFECAKKNDIYCAEAMWTWFSDVAIQVKNWVKNGEIGEIEKIEFIHAFPGVIMNKNSRLLLPETAGGALLDVGVYPIAYCYNLFGSPKDIKCEGVIKNGIDISEIVTMVYDGFKCVSKMSLCYLKQNAIIKGTKGEIILPTFFHTANKATLKNENGKQVFRGKTDYLTEFTRAADEIKAGKKESDYIPFSSTIATMKIMDECRRQMNLVYPFEAE